MWQLITRGLYFAHGRNTQQTPSECFNIFDVADINHTVIPLFLTSTVFQVNSYK